MAFNFVGSGLNNVAYDDQMSGLGLHVPNGMNFAFNMGTNGNHMPMPMPMPMSRASAPRTVNHMANLSQNDVSQGFEGFVYSNDQSAISDNHQPITHDDQAASTLMSMSSNSQDHSQPMAPSGSSWGALNIGNTSSNYAGEPTSASTIDMPSTPNISNNFQRHGRTTSHAQYPPHDLVQQGAHPVNFTHTRHPSLPMNNSGAHKFQQTTGQGQNNTQHRPPIYQYGSDQSFSQQGYQAANYSVPEEKYNNLLNLPLAGVVRDPAASIAPVQQTGGIRNSVQQHRNSAPNNLQQLSSAALAHQHANSQPTGSTSQRSVNHQRSTHAMETPVQSQQSRKRRRSQSEEEDRALYDQPVQNAQNIANTARSAPIVLKQETASEQDQTNYTTPPGPSNKLVATCPGTAGTTASASPSTPAAATSKAFPSKKRRTDAKQPRNNLTEAQKRENHIASEQKRRDYMKGSFAELSIYVPVLASGGSGFSRSDMVQKTGDFLHALQNANSSLMSSYGIKFDDIPERIRGPHRTTYAMDASED
jgi:hypothetical protein